MNSQSGEGRAKTLLLPKTLTLEAIFGTFLKCKTGDGCVSDASPRSLNAAFTTRKEETEYHVPGRGMSQTGTCRFKSNTLMNASFTRSSTFYAKPRFYKIHLNS